MKDLIFQHGASLYSDYTNANKHYALNSEQLKLVLVARKEHADCMSDVNRKRRVLQPFEIL